MDVQRFSRNFASKIEENLRPISAHILPFTKLKSQSQKINLSDLPNSVKKIDIENAYKILKENASMDNKANIKIITCLKSAQKCWEQYTNSSNKNGQIACTYQVKLKRIQQKFQSQISKLIIQGQLEKVKQVSQLLRPMIDYLQKKSRKYKEHESQFKIKSRKMQEQSKQNQQKDDEIKQEMIDLVEKFKRYALNINENLSNDTTVIKKIGDSQDKHLHSLQNKNTSMEQIIKEQKLGFFQLIGMGIFAIVIWVIGLMVILIV